MKLPLTPLLFMLLIGYCSIATSNEKTINFVTEHLPPFQIVDTAQGEHSGAMVEIIDAMIAQSQLANNIDINTQFLPWEKAYNMALKEKNTFIFSMRRGAKREDKFIWLDEIYQAKPTLMKLAKRTDISVNNITDLTQYSIGVVRGDYDNNLLEKHHLNANIRHGLNYKELWLMLAKNQVDLIMTTPAVTREALAELKAKPNLFAQAYQFEYADNALYLAANKNTDADIIKTFQQALRTIKNNGTYQAILNKWAL